MNYYCVFILYYLIIKDNKTIKTEFNLQILPKINAGQPIKDCSEKAVKVKRSMLVCWKMGGECFFSKIMFEMFWRKRT